MTPSATALPLSAPPRSMTQRMDALERANNIRSYRANLKRDMKAGRVRASDVLTRPVDEVQTMKVHALLLAIPKLGRVRVNKVLDVERISPSKTIGGLSDRQRYAIANAIHGR